MNIEELIEIIKTLGGEATVEEICKVFQKKWGMYIDSSFKSGVQHILAANPNLVRFNKFTKKWELGADDNLGSKYLYVSDQRFFKYIEDAMREIFAFRKVKRECGYFKIDDKYAAWFPQFTNKEWTNTISEDGRFWYERPNDGHETGMETRLRYVFAHDKFGTRGKVYKFTGLFEHKEIREDGTRVFEIIDDKVPIRGRKIDTDSLRRMIVCNVTYMKYYNGITDEDQIVGGGGKYPTENKDGGEKYNFHADAQGIIHGFVETGYTDGETGNIDKAKGMLIENIDPDVKNQDYVEGVRVVFISKGPNNDKNVVVGWYDNAKVYRTRQVSSEQFGYNLECKADDAHLIDEVNRIFEYPKKNDDDTFNFGQSNVSYPRILRNEATQELVERLNKYLDSLLLGDRKFFFRSTIVTTWNYHKEKGKPGDIMTFSATSNMKIGDYLLIYVGKEGNEKDAGIYALSEIVTEPYTNNNPEDVSFGSTAVQAKYIVASDTPVISYEKTQKIAKVLQGAHVIDEEYYDEIRQAFGLN